MRPAWRLAINTLSARRSRTALLVATVALSAALIAAVACAMASVHKGVRSKIEATVGAADLRVQKVGKDLFDLSVLREVESWPEVKLAVGRAQGSVVLKNTRTGKDSSTVGNGVMVDREYQLRPLVMVSGRAVEREGEIALDALAAQELEAQVGDTLEVQRWGDPITLTVVGIAKRPPLGMLSRPESYVSLAQMGAIQDKPDKLREMDVLLHDTRQAESVSKAKANSLGAGIVLRPASKITSGMDKNLQSSQVGMFVASMLAFLSAAFIILTGLTTNVTERQRELAMLRCIGGTKVQLAESQLAIGLIIGALGAIVGVPLGIAGAAVLVRLLPEQLPGGFAMNPLGLALAVGGSLVAGLLGALWPAWRAARTSPLEALSVRARPPRMRVVALAGIAGLVLAAAHISILTVPRDGDTIFWMDATMGLPSFFTGYFLLAVPVMVVVVLIAGAGVSRLLGLPRGVLVRTMLATPFRSGFTAGAMMMGLALLVGIWTNGEAIMRDWLGSLRFPDAFVSGISMSEKTLERIRTLPFVTDTCAITLQTFKTDAFGVKSLQSSNTSFVAFEPDPFFRTTELTWVEGDKATALRRLNEGGAVIVANEFKVTKGIGVGSMITLEYEGKPYQFEVVGVVNSPGLDIASKFFDIGDEYLDQAVNAVFGSREDLKRLFGNTGIQLIQINFTPGTDDVDAMKQIRKLAGFEVVSAGSGREIKNEIGTFLKGSLFVFSLIAVASMLVACFGVANLIVAGIQARQFEFGVLRAIGAQRGLLARLVAGEALLIALTACILGTIMGTQAAWGGQRMYQVLLGLELSVRIPAVPTMIGWVVLTLITLGAAAPAIWRLTLRPPRELLAAVRG